MNIQQIVKTSGLAAITLLLAVGTAAAGDGLPQLNPATMMTQIFWLVICFVTLYFMLTGFALPRVQEVLDARDARISWDITMADELRRESEVTMVATKRVLDEANARSKEIITVAATQRAAADQRMLSLFDGEIARRVREAENRILTVKFNALSELGHVATEITQEVVVRLTGAGIGADEAATVEAAISGHGK